MFVSTKLLFAETILFFMNHYWLSHFLWQTTKAYCLTFMDEKYFGHPGSSLKLKLKNNLNNRRGNISILERVYLFIKLAFNIIG